MYKRIFAAAMIGLMASVSGSGAVQKRTVKDNVLFSEALPKIAVEVKGNFEYVGRFDFKIRDVAQGERFVFVDAKCRKVRRMFIAQFEGFLPHIDDYYRYSFANAMTFGDHRFRHNTYAYSNREARKRNPAGEGVLTEDFLKKKGYELEDELMMSRFLTVTGPKKKHELILYYLENASSTRHSLGDFYRNDKPTPIWREISKELKSRSLKTFVVK